MDVGLSHPSASVPRMLRGVCDGEVLLDGKLHVTGKGCLKILGLLILRSLHAFSLLTADQPCNFMAENGIQHDTSQYDICVLLFFASNSEGSFVLHRHPQASSTVYIHIHCV